MLCFGGVEAGEAGRRVVGAPAEEVRDRGCSAGQSLEGSRVVAANSLEQELSWAMDVMGGRPTPKSLLARRDATAVAPAYLWVALPWGGGQSRQLGVSWIVEKLGKPPGVHCARAKPWGSFCPELPLDALLQ